MHPTQQEILRSLRQAESRQFSELLRDVAETSDNLTYHLKQLQKAGFVASPSKGEYALAPKGLVYLNNNLELNHDLFPTVSCMLELHNVEGKVLVMKKRKQPYLGMVHLLTFGVTSAKPLEAQIQDFLAHYHVSASTITFKSVYRERAADADGLFVFDKVFLVFRGEFIAYESSADDRQFLTATPAELNASPQTLPATKAVLGHESGSDYAEAGHNNSD